MASINERYLNRILKELKRRLDEGEGFTRIIMKKDKRQLDINQCIDGSYFICDPPYVVKDCMPHKYFNDLEGVAAFIAQY